MYLPERSSARIVALAAVLRMLERKRCGEPKVAQMPYRHPYAGEVSNSHFSNSHILVRAKVVRSVPERPANYSHVLARRLTKPFPFRQPANYFHGFARRPLFSDSHTPENKLVTHARQFMNPHKRVQLSWMHESKCLVRK